MEERRLALAMNGGVSLAIWIGGASYELWRHSRGIGSYSDSKITPSRIDVLSGTSAGGINAVFLALAALYPEHAAEVEDGATAPRLSGLRDLWLDHGGFEPPEPNGTHLIRDPLGKNPQSVLNGSHFRSKLRFAIESLTPSVQNSSKLPPPTGAHPVDLQLTATRLRGRQTQVVLGDGGVLHERQHAVNFRFAHGAGQPSFTLANGQPASRDHVLDDLADAARSTASFPLAFEPVELDAVRNGRQPTWTEPRSANPAATFGDDRLVDGGVLNNLPVDRVVEAIFRMPASQPVDRHLILMVPDPSDGPTSPEGGKQVEPTVASVVSASLVGIPRSQSIAVALSDLAQNNSAVAALRSGREQLLSAKRDDLLNSAGLLWPSYVTNRRGHSARMLSRHLLATDAAEHRALAQQVSSAIVSGRIPLPWLPPVNGADGGPGWGAASQCWGSSTVRRLVGVLLHLIELARSAGASSTELNELSTRVHDQREIADLAHPYDLGTAALAADLIATLGDASSESQSFADNVVDAYSAVLTHWPIGSANPTEARSTLATCLTQLADVLVGIARLWPELRPKPRPKLLESLDSVDEARCVLLAIEITTQAFSSFELRSEQSVTTWLLSPRRVALLDNRRRSTARSKLAGDDLGHFGAFLKRSWRANDWLWGRLDAVALLREMLSLKEADVLKLEFDVVRDEAPVVCQAVARDIAAGAASLHGRRLAKLWAGSQPPSDWAELRRMICPWPCQSPRWWPGKVLAVVSR